MSSKEGGLPPEGGLGGLTPGVGGGCCQTPRVLTFRHGTAAVGTHPTGMHSCYLIYFPHALWKTMNVLESPMGTLKLAGRLRDVTGSWNVSFYFTGGVLLLSALTMLLAPFISRWQRKRTSQQESQG